MRLTGILKKEVENTRSLTEAREVIAKAGMELTDDELDMVTGGLEAHDLSEYAKSTLKPPTINIEELLNNKDN